MKKRVLFLSLYTFEKLSDGYICADLVKQFRDSGHDVTVVTSEESGTVKENRILTDEGITHIKIACGPIQKTSAIKKILNLARLDRKAQKVLKKDFREKFNLVVCMVSHCAFFKTVRFIKHRDGAFVYNMVKDIFPANAADLGMMKRNGLLYKWFKGKENKYYKISDALGAISPAAAAMLKNDNPWYGRTVEVNPNSCYPSGRMLADGEKSEILNRHRIPENRPIFVYGGNLGKPQGIDFLLECVKRNEQQRENGALFVIAGSGTEFERTKAFFTENGIRNSMLLSRLGGKEFEDLCFASDAGLVFLDRRFTVPNYPSRTLSYMQARLPVLFAVDEACDAGIIAAENGYGFACLSDETEKFMGFVDMLASDPEKRKEMGEAAYRFLCEHYTVQTSYDIIMKHLEVPHDV